MWSQIFDVATFHSRFDDVPDGFRCQAFASDLFLSSYSPKDCTLIYLSCVGPLIDRALRPHRNWNGANVLSLSNQVGDHPVLLADLKIFHSESYQFAASQATPNEQGESRSITFASEAIQPLCEQSPRLDQWSTSFRSERPNVLRLSLDRFRLPVRDSEGQYQLPRVPRSVWSSTLKARDSNPVSREESGFREEAGILPSHS